MNKYIRNTLDTPEKFECELDPRSVDEIRGALLELSKLVRVSVVRESWIEAVHGDTGEHAAHHKAPNIVGQITKVSCSEECTDFDRGMLCGKRAALLWGLGTDWDAHEPSPSETKQDYTEEISRVLENAGGKGAHLMSRTFHGNDDPFKESIHLPVGQTPRSPGEIGEALDEIHDRVWYNRHLDFRCGVEEGQEHVHPEVWARALLAAKAVEEKYGEDNIGPIDDFDYGMITGKLSALRWMLGDEWDNLDT